MKAAIVAPTEFLPYTQSFSNYHLVLTHKVIYSSKYQEYYKARSKAGDYLILDNGAVEKNGHSVPMRDIVLAAILVKPTVIVLPDFLFDGERTLDEFENAVKSPSFQFLKRVQPDVKIAAVVQGVDQDEWYTSFEILNSLAGLDMLGIPKVTGQTFGVRWKALDRISRKVKKPCHLLGVWWQSTLDDLRREASYPFVVGVDTPKPVRLAAQGKDLSCWNELEHDRGFLDRKHDEPVDMELLKRNCQEFVEVCNEKT